jgi:hypothetical protein
VTHYSLLTMVAKRGESSPAIQKREIQKTLRNCCLRCVASARRFLGGWLLLGGSVCDRRLWGTGGGLLLVGGGSGRLLGRSRGESGRPSLGPGVVSEQHRGHSCRFVDGIIRASDPSISSFVASRPGSPVWFWVWTGPFPADGSLAHLLILE